MKNSILSLQIIYIAVIISSGSFIAVAAFILNYQIQAAELALNQTFILLISTFIGTLLIISGILIVKRKTAELISLSTSEKINKYKSLIIIRASAIEAAAILFIICYLLFKHELFIYESVFSFAVLSVFFPTKYKVCTELSIDLQDLNNTY